MPRHLNLRQIEAFKAVIEHGTVSRGAEILNISQPAMSKLIVHLEADTGLKLFDRVKGRLAPTEQAMRLHDEIGRIFAGVRQVENAVEAIRREGQGRLAIGVLPALSTSFIVRATTDFLKTRSSVFCSVESLSSHWIVERIIAKKLDIGLVSPATANPNVSLEPLMEHPLVCIMPRTHPLASKRKVKAKDLQGAPFVSLPLDSYTGRLIREVFASCNVEPKTVLIADTMPILCEFVADNLGVSLVHPLVASGLQGQLAIRRFEPDVLYTFQLCRSIDSKNTHLVEAFAQELRAKAATISKSLLSKN